MSAPAPHDNICVILPVYDDWAAVEQLLPLLDRSLSAAGRVVDVLLVDDGSRTPCPLIFTGRRFAAFHAIRILELRRNLGNQRAIAVALARTYAEANYDAIVVMDSDGEDNPADVPRLLQKYDECGKTAIVFAARRRRSESWLFRAGYFAYRQLHVLVTGIAVRVGNFSVVPRSLLGRLVVTGELWSHYPAAVFVGRIPYTSIDTQRAQRLAGSGKMNVTGLVVHGLSGMAVHSEIIGVRLLLAALTLGTLAAMAIGAVVWIRLATDLAIPGWATNATLLLTLIILAALMLALSFSMTALAGRRTAGFIPQRDYQWFVGGLKDLYVAER